LTLPGFLPISLFSHVWLNQAVTEQKKRNKRTKRKKEVVARQSPEPRRDDALSLTSLSATLANVLRSEEVVELRSKRPVTAELIETWVAVLLAGVGASQRKEYSNALNVFTKCVDCTGEIATWVAGERALPSPTAILSSTQEWLANGFLTAEQVTILMSNAEHRPPGRPISKRLKATEALDERRTTSHSWTQLARTHCDCRKDEHTAICTDRLRHQVRELEQFLVRLSRWRKWAEDFLHGDNPT
jgi:hypothetical protein